MVIEEDKARYRDFDGNTIFFTVDGKDTIGYSIDKLMFTK